ncbi:hypothetical protein HanXRQr2_Chr10g0454591 [Helianthus annuus]|uniref:Uncharacterized protein n=1 Tax=Helianthus annuus TaxID=4232 RepID=A0A251TP58_HELAN|nr:hypothetical protein HanXRQr2_Chr10g0454591 [Helianthus annuus]KAJ0523115.1 hypothetical protein HanIR_Chr10g0490211 [Helianthus annuus]
MEDDEGGRIKAQVEEGGKQEEEDLLVENQSSSASSAATAASSALKGKRPLVENPSSASAPAASGTKSQVEEGAKRPCLDEETTKPNHTEDEEEEELIDYGEPRMKDGGYYLRFEADRAIIVGERPEPVVRSLGRPPPNVLTFKRMQRRLAETGLGYLHPDDPLGKIPWNPFPFPVGKGGFSFYGSDT